MKGIIGNKYLTLLCRLTLGAIFIYASIDKIAYPGGFAVVIRNYKILPEQMTNILAIILPWLEIFCGIFLVVGIFTRTSAAIISLMLIVFIIAISSAITRGLDIDCGCFKTVDQASKVGLKRIWEDLGMLALGFQIFFFANPFASIEGLFARRKQDEDE